MPFEHFQYTFANDLPLEEQRAGYDRDIIPESRRVARGALSGAARVDLPPPHAPLLMIAGDKDHIMPASLNRSNYKRYRKSPSRTEFKEFPGRAHYTIIAGCGWEEVADCALEWAIGARSGAELLDPPSVGKPTRNKEGHTNENDQPPRNTITAQDGVEIYYKDWGPRDAQPLVFHHGWPLSGDDWDTQMLYFLSQGYRVIAHDRRGHSRSSQVSDGHDMDHYAADIAAVVEHLNLRDAIHIGHSTGGGEATHYVAATARVRAALRSWC